MVDTTVTSDCAPFTTYSSASCFAVIFHCMRSILCTLVVAFGHEFSYGEAVRVYGIKQQAIEPKPALSVLTSTSLGSGFNVVMVQWALGKHVPEWESELQSLRATHLPEPVVATGDPQH
jgi:hypothetical protein